VFGGDTRSWKPMSFLVFVLVMGFVFLGLAMSNSGVRAGDEFCLSGTFTYGTNVQ